MTNTPNVDSEQSHTSMDRAIERVYSAMTGLQTQLQLLSNPVDGVCPIMYRDHIINIALPWANFDTYQTGIACSRGVPDTLLFTQLFDLLSSLENRSIIDVGAYTGLQGLVLRHVLSPSHLYLIEPMKVVQEPLRRTIAANPEGCEVSLIQAVVDDGESMMDRSVTRPEKMAETTYLRRAEGKIPAISIDSLNVSDVGLITLDFPAPKIYALRGALGTLREQRPAVLLNLLGRDTNELKEFMSGISYTDLRIGANSVLFLPE